MDNQLVVTYMDGNLGYFRIGKDRSWIINPAMNVLVVGKGLSRSIIPLGNIRYIEFDEKELAEGFSLD